MKQKNAFLKTMGGLLLAIALILGCINVPVLETHAAEAVPTVSYAVHTQSYGWMKPVNNGQKAGTTGQGKRLEAIAIALDMNGVTDHEGNPLTGGIQYSAHVQNIGWQQWVQADATGESVSDMISQKQYAGTTGRGKRIEAIKIKLTGKVAEEYEVLYRVHMQTYGWSTWTRDGQIAGTTGQAKRIEAIQIKLIQKPETPTASISYSVHVQKNGWTIPVGDGQTAGTIGQAKRLEAIKINLTTTGVTGGIEYNTHIQSKGWMGNVLNGTVSGTTGQAKRLEAIRINLTGDISAYYDIYYRVHCQSLGWMDWAKNGQNAGTEGGSKRMEAIQIKLVKKGASAPGSTKQPYKYFEPAPPAPEVPTKDTYEIRVNREACCVTIYKAGVPVKAMTCSPGAATPTGTFYLGKQWRWTTLNGGVWGQYVSQITGSFLFHSILYRQKNPRTLITSSYNNLGQRVSHGCVRLCVADAKWIFENCPSGTKIVIYNSPNPGPLGKPVLNKIPGGQSWDPTDPSI